MPASKARFDLDLWLSRILNDLIPALDQSDGRVIEEAIDKVVVEALGDEKPKDLYAAYPKFATTNLRVAPIDRPERATYDRYDYRRAMVYSGVVIADLISSGGGATLDRSAKLEALLFGTNTSGQDFPLFIEKLLMMRPRDLELFGEWRNSVEAGLAALSALTARDNARGVDDRALDAVQRFLRNLNGLDEIVVRRLKNSIEMGTSSSTAFMKRCTENYLHEFGSEGLRTREKSRANQG